MRPLIKPYPHLSHISRRSFLKWGTIAATAGLVPRAALAKASRFLAAERKISLYNMHTGEQLTVPYCVKGEYMPDALTEINHILRDHRTDDIRPIDTRLLDLLHALSVNLSATTPFHVVSGYRSPKTNQLLRKKSRGVSKNSLHMYGRAIDIYLPCCRLDKLRQMATVLKVGGVGYYPKSHFVHVDTGKIRYW